MDEQPDPLAAHLRRLSKDALAALVADVWAARGYETDRREGVVVARGVDTQRIQVWGTDDRPAVTDDFIDLVVSPGGADGVATRTIEADELAQLLRYGLDVDHRDSLCERHLGAPPAALDTPWPVRVRRRLWGLTRPAAFVVGVFICLLVASSVVGWPESGIVGRTDGPEESAGVRNPIDDGVGSSTPTVEQDTSRQLMDTVGGEHTESNLPPGVGTAGVEDASRLDSAHDRAIGNRSYTLRADLYWPRGGQPGAERVHRSMDFRVAADGRYLLETTVRAQADNSTPPSQPDLTVYHDGRDWYVAELTDSSVEYRRVSDAQEPPVVPPEPTVLRKHLASWYLSTPETNLTTSTRESQQGYRLIGRGQPLGAGRGITNYTVQAFVHPDGLVKEFSAQSTRRVTPPVNQRFRVTYDRFGTTTVSTPEWVVQEYDLNRSGHNGSTPIPD